MAKGIDPAPGWDFVKYLFTLLFPFVTAWFGFFLRGFEVNNGHLKDKLSDIRDELEKLVDAGGLYWRKNSIETPQPEEDVALEAEILGRVHAVNSLFEDVSHRFDNAKADLIRTLISELRQALTGADFAADLGHMASSSAISRSFVAAAQLRVQLQVTNRRRRVFFNR